MEQRLQDRIALVTGAGQGIGKGVALRLAREGASVVAADINQPNAEQTAQEVRASSRKASAVAIDLARLVEIQPMVDRVVAEFSRIDILINDAAYNTWVAFPDLEGLTLEIWQKILQTNTTGPYMLMRAVGPIMKRQGQGRIVNIGSIAGFQPAGSSIAYSVSKAALTHLTRCMAAALAPEVLVNCVAPGFLEGTRMSSNLSPPYVEKAKKAALIGKAADKEDVVDQILTFLRTESTTGQTVIIDGGRVFH